MNQFMRELTTGANTAKTWNGAVSHASTGSSLLDYFAKCGSYRNRTEAEVSGDMASIFAENPTQAMKMVLYNRMITRKPVGENLEVEKVQRGQGQKDEFVKSIAWLESNYPDILYKNLWLIPQIGCWKDFWYDSASTGFFYYVDPAEVYALVREHLEDENARGLIAKFLPKIRSRKNTTSNRHRRLNAWARGFCAYMNWTERDYRKFKSNPQNTAHQFQREMCSNHWDDIDFGKISGKALFNLIGRRGKDSKTSIERHNLEAKYLEWIKEQPVAKFTGYVYELYQAASSYNRSVSQKFTYDAQFEKLIDTATKDVDPEVRDRKVMCAIDTSGSMGASVGDNVTALDVCVGLGIYFSKLITGYFADTIMKFSSSSEVKKLTGTFCDRVDQINQDGWYMGSTNFQSVIDEIVRIRKANPDVPIEDYPDTLLVVSDMQWNATGTFESNYEMCQRKLKSVGLNKIKFIWWQVNGRHTSDVPSTMWDQDAMMISGFDPSIVTMLLNQDDTVIDDITQEERSLTAREKMDNCLNQEILNFVRA